MRSSRLRLGVCGTLLLVTAAFWAARSSDPGHAAARGTARGLGGLVFSADHPGDRNNAIIAVRTRQPLVALSFDDGPDPAYTPQILRLLRENHAHATFFVIGRRVAAHPALARATRAARNEHGNHTLSHALLPPLGAGRLAREIGGGARAIRWAGLPAATLFRPPHGYFDARVSAAAAHVGLKLIGWDQVVEGGLSSPGGVARAVARLTKAIRPGSIVLAHDGRHNRSRTVAVIARLLPALRARGLRVVTVSRLLQAAGR